jgi:predicted small lipoprotein YifL
VTDLQTTTDLTAASRNISALILCLLVLLSLTACGLKDDLYLPAAASAVTTDIQKSEAQTDPATGLAADIKSETRSETTSATTSTTGMDATTDAAEKDKQARQLDSATKP